MTVNLRISGRLHPDNRLVLRPGYTVDRAREAYPTQPVLLLAEVLDEGDQVIARAPLGVKRYTHGTALAVKGDVPLPDDAARLLIWLTDQSGRPPIRLATLDIPRSAPDVSIVESPAGEARGRQRIAWDARGDPPPVEFVVDYSHDDGATWQPVSRRLGERELTIDVDELPGGEQCRISVSASNGMRSGSTVGPPFRVDLKPCRALIQQPHDGERIAPDATLIGNGWWLEEGRVEARELAWTSDRDGELGHGNIVTTRLSPGTHTLTLTAGTGERAGTGSVAVEVVEPSPPGVAAP